MLLRWLGLTKTQRRQVETIIREQIEAALEKLSEEKKPLIGFKYEPIAHFEEE